VEKKKWLWCGSATDLESLITDLGELCLFVFVVFILVVWWKVTF
jgi:hypothetical protein